MIHDDNPFADAPDSRDPVRRFRGRLGAPVTIITAGDGERRTGLTVSSLMVVEGEPGRVAALVGPTSDLWDVVGDTRRFVVHICSRQDRHTAEVFAGLRPSPGGLFAEAPAQGSDWGPIFPDLANRVYCSLEERRELGHSGVIIGTIDRVVADDIGDPLLYFRGRYRELR
ncbi:MAG TPA: flavin reductase family protein [Acidimicrobiia bacterium]|nr:flavin reductase family protein [Acidimicrobiia bacterium]